MINLNKAILFRFSEIKTLKEKGFYLSARKLSNIAEKELSKSKARIFSNSGNKY